MSSIAMLYSNFTYEEEIKKSLTAATGYTLICDRDLFDEFPSRFSMDREKAVGIILGKESVFNAFTREKERAISCLKLLVAEKIVADNVLLCGRSSLLVDDSISHILRVGIFDEKNGRIRRGLAKGIDEKQAEKLIAIHDKKTTDFVQQLGIEDLHTSQFYDIRILVGGKTVREISQSIIEQYRRPAILPNEKSKVAAADFLLKSKLEHTLAENGYITKIICQPKELTIKVNQSSFNFTRLAENIHKIVENVDEVQESKREINVIASAEVAVSIISDQKFISRPKVLLVDDEKEFVQTLSERLATRQYGSYPVFDGEQALACLEKETPDVMVLDLKMPGMQGIEVLEHVKREQPEIEIIILTGHGSEKDKAACMEHGAFAYLQKPINIKDLTREIDTAYAKIAQKRLQKIYKS